MKIADGWHLVLGQDGERSLSDSRDCCAFALETSEGLVMFDAGAGTVASQLDAALMAAGFASGPAHLLLTHAHADHSGGAALIAERHAPTIYAGGLTADWLEGANEETISLAAAKRAGVYPADYRLRPCAVDRRLEDGEELRIGEASIRVVATPGHSADHLSFLVDAHDVTVLVGGDALFSEGRVVLQDTWDCSVADTCATIRKLAGLQFDWLLPGHGPRVLRTAHTAVDRAMERVSRLLPPLNLM